MSPQDKNNPMGRATSRFERPSRPLPISLLNAAGRGAARIGLQPRLDVDSLLLAARKKAGLREFGDESFVEPLSLLVDSLESEARLSTLGRIIQRRRFVDALVNRLRVHQLLEAHPEIEDIPLDRVLVIAGLQRTGTTTLHRLLASMPDARSLASWEAVNPAPFPGETPGRPTARKLLARRAEQGLRYLAPQFFAIHPVEHDAPEEDVLLLDHHFMSQSAEAMMRVPSYATWLEGQDNRPAYDYMATLMRVLLWQRPGRHWVLKTPHHLEYLDTLLDVLPGARIIQTHRDPQKTTASFCSMVAHGACIFSDEVDADELAQHWLRKIRRVLERSMAVRSRLPERLFLDVSYYDLVAEPIKVLEEIYRFAGLEFGENVEQAARGTGERNVQHRHGRHRYALSDFGLDEARLEAELGFYRSHYQVPFESQLPSRGEQEEGKT
jgi:hypothetical protein